MKASELRIGNWVVRAKNGEAKQIDAQGIANFASSESNIGMRMYVPIKLTEEWLKKFGFEENRGFTSYRIAISPLMKWACRTFIVVVVARNHHADGEAWLDLISERADHDYPELQTCSIPCSYVHQLQNLHWALTGNELQIQQP